MGLDDANGQTQAEAGARARGLRREERIEDSAQVLGRNAGAVVLDLHEHVGSPRHGSHGQRAVAARRLHGVNGVAEQVEEDLLKLVEIGPDGWGRLETGDETNLVELELRRLKIEGRLDDFAEIHPPPLGRISAREDQQVADDSGSARAW